MPASSVFIIAEAGICHNGYLPQALRLADAAKASGADAVKFQHFDSRKLWGDDRIAQYQLTEDELREIYEHCRDLGIEFMCTPFGVEELAFLKPMLKRVKIASGCIGKLSLVMAARDTGLPLIISTGMSDEGDINGALAAAGLTPPTLLHCTSAYPCHLEDVNLRAMLALPKPHGYSDHTNGITVALAAVALGATVIEKHLTLDRNAEGPDHKTSITPKEFRAMRMAIGEVEAAMGDGVKRVLACERGLRKAWRGD